MFHGPVCSSCRSRNAGCAQELRDGAPPELLTVMLRRLDAPNRFELHMLALVLAEGARADMLRPSLKAAVAPGGAPPQSMLVPASSPPRGGLAGSRSLHSLEEEPEEDPEEDPTGFDNPARLGMERVGSFTAARASSAMADCMSLGPRPNRLAGGAAIGTSSGSGAGASSGGDGGAAGGGGSGGGTGGSRLMGSGGSSVLVPQMDQVHACQSTLNVSGETRLAAGICWPASWRWFGRAVRLRARCVHAHAVGVQTGDLWPGQVIVHALSVRMGCGEKLQAAQSQISTGGGGGGGGGGGSSNAAAADACAGGWQAHGLLQPAASMSSDGNPGFGTGGSGTGTGGGGVRPSTNAGHSGEAQRSFVAGVARAALKHQVGAQR